MRRPVNRSTLPKYSVQFYTHSTPVAQCPAIYVPDPEGGSHREVDINPDYAIDWEIAGQKFRDAVLHAHDTNATHVDVIIAVRGAPLETAPNRQPQTLVRKITLRKDTDAQH